MADRSNPKPAPVGPLRRSVLEIVHAGLTAIAKCRSLQEAATSAVEALVASADDVVVIRVLLHGVDRDEVVGPLGGSTARRALLDRFLAARGDTQPTQSIIAGVHVERAPIVVDDLELGVFEVFSFEVGAPEGFDTALTALAHAVGLVAVAERDGQRVRDQLQLIGNLSHELRTPLTTLLGYTDLLTRSWRDLEDAERDRVLAVLDRQARRMVRLSVEASAIAKAGDLGALEVRFERVDLADAVETAVTDLLSEHEITVRCGAELWVHADPDRLQQMLLNLLGNALAYGRPPIEVRADRGPTGSFVHVTVTDHGPGIDPALLPRVFEPFTRGRSDPTDDHAGLGLSIVRRLAQRHGGDLFYEPNRPVGAKMTLSLPAMND